MDVPWMSDVVSRALRQGRTVELTHREDDRGIHIEIDGERLTDGSSGLAMESFDYPLIGDRGPHVSEGALDLADRVMFSGENPRCHDCYSAVKRRPVTDSCSGESVHVARCVGCKRAYTEDPADE